MRCFAHPPKKPERLSIFTEDTHGHIALRALLTSTAASSKLARAKLEVKRFTLWHLGMTMQTLVSETLGQLALSLPEPASSKRISLEAGEGFCQACTLVSNTRETAGINKVRIRKVSNPRAPVR